ncbi:MAG: type II toxin-antitoxin system RelE/ParE family toxin [Nitrospinales bacterium]
MDVSLVAEPRKKATIFLKRPGVSSYERLYLAQFEKDIKKIKANPDLRRRLQNKVEEILKNPYHYKPLRNVLKNKRRTHVGNYVLIFEVQKNKNVVVFHSFQHHDTAYKKR